MNKTHWKKLTNPNYLGAYSINEGQELVCRIKKVVRENVKNTDGKEEECTVAYLDGQKPMILNKTNCKAIARAYNTPYIEDWSGKNITIFATKVKAFGEWVEALRVKPTKPALPTLTESHEKWEVIVQSLTAKNATMDQVKERYKVSKEIESKLIELCVL